MILVSPVLDFGWWQQPDHAPLPMVSLLPSLAAAAMEARRDLLGGGAARRPRTTPPATTSTDLLRGVEDEAAVARLVDRVSGADRPRPRRGRAGGGPGRRRATSPGRVPRRRPADQPLRRDGRQHRPRRAGARADPVLDALTAPLTSAMLAHYRDTLGWLPDRRYLLLNGGVSRAWDWGGGRGQPEAVERAAPTCWRSTPSSGCSSSTATPTSSRPISRAS